MKIEALEALPRDMVGDGQSPNVFFVSKAPLGVVMITRDFDAAYQYWLGLPRDVETTLEDRQFGVIASTERDEDTKRLTTYDDSMMFKNGKRRKS